MALSMPKKIDVHSHFLPKFYQEACRRNGHANPDGMPYLPDWSPESHLELMDKLGIAQSILSISSPGTHLVAGNDELAEELTRDVNQYASQLKKSNPSRFGYFASLPLPDVQGSLKEIPRAIEEGCNGFAVETNVHGHYLGDAIFDPVFDELNRQGTTLFIHPTTPHCPCSPEALAAGHTPADATPFAGKYPHPMLEFFFDTARAVANLFLSGTIARCPNLKIILPHLGGAFPPLLSRTAAFGALVLGQAGQMSEELVMNSFKTQIWFDMAGVAFPSQIRGLLYGVGVPHTRLMYGSDYPFTQPKGVEHLLGQMDKGVKELFSEAEIEDLYHRNATKLLAS